MKKILQKLNRAVETYGKYAQYLFIGTTFALIGMTLYANWNELASFDWNLNYPWFFASLLLVSAAILSLAGWWTLSIRLLQKDLGWKQGFRIWVLAQTAKYLPGGIWNYISRVYASDRAGVSKTHTMISLVIETVLRVQSAIIVFMVSLPLWPTFDWSYTQLLLIVCTLAFGFVLLYPPILNWGVNVLLQVLHRHPIDVTSLKYRHILGLLAGHISAVAGCGGAFYLLVSSVHRIPIGAALPITGMFAFAVIAGFLNPLTPHGLGTREGLLALFLNYYVPLPIAIVISLLSRLWSTLSEIIGIPIALLIPSARPKSTDTKANDNSVSEPEGSTPGARSTSQSTAITPKNY